MYHLTYVFYSIINMPYISPFRCPKVLFGGKSPFQWQKSFSVFSRTRKTYLLINPIGALLFIYPNIIIFKTNFGQQIMHFVANFHRKGEGAFSLYKSGGGGGGLEAANCRFI